MVWLSYESQYAITPETANNNHPLSSIVCQSCKGPAALRDRSSSRPAVS
jgi:hypothetical protein